MFRVVGVSGLERSRAAMADCVLRMGNDRDVWEVEKQGAGECFFVLVPSFGCQVQLSPKRDSLKEELNDQDHWP